ncbi:MAG: lipid IV(A) palmitoyltransferase PagP [Rhodocyclaceae bacterium]|nr:lipid IV(A) palmitoyltransferase PagP [Rhodocyclaceae bacterium]
MRTVEFPDALRVLTGTLLALALVPAQADGFAASIGSAYDRASAKLGQIWDKGGNEFYLPVNTFHLRSAYDADKIRTFNENPKGLGLGKSLYDPDGDYHGLYVMAFGDSHYKPEYMLGYAYKTFWPARGDLKVGLGYTVFLTARTDYAHYAPIPGILPMVSVEYKKFSVDSTYVPGGHGYGNVFFTSLKFPF